MSVNEETNPDSEDGAWHELPDLVISHIFSFLSLSDRVKASGVCRSWSNGFHSPTLWRSTNIWLHADPSRLGGLKSISDDDSDSELEYCDITGPNMTASPRKKLRLQEVEGHDVRKEYAERSDKDEAGSRERGGGDSLEGRESPENEETENDVDDFDCSETDDGSVENFFSPKEENERKVKTTLTFRDSMALVFADKYGKYIKKLQLICDPVGPPSFEKSFENKLFKFLNSLIQGGCQLHDVVVFFSYFSENLKTECRRSLINLLSEFFAVQHELKTVFIGNSLNDDEVCLLEAIVKGSGSTLKQLHCVYYANTKANEKNKGIYHKVLTQMPALQRVGLSIQSTGHQEAVALNSCKHLETIYLYNLEKKKNSIWRNVYPLKEAYPYLAWKKPLRIHPKMLYSCGGEFWIKCTSIPDVDLTLRAVVYVNTQFELNCTCLNDEPTMTSIINFIATNYATDLVSICIVDDWNREEEDDAIRRLLLSCPELRELRLNTPISLQLFEEIHSLQLQNKIDLQTFWYKSGDLIDEEMEDFREVRKKYDELIESRDWWCELIVMDNYVINWKYLSQTSPRKTKTVCYHVNKITFRVRKS